MYSSLPESSSGWSGEQGFSGRSPAPFHEGLIVTLENGAWTALADWGLERAGSAHEAKLTHPEQLRQCERSLPSPPIVSEVAGEGASNGAHPATLARTEGSVSEFQQATPLSHPGSVCSRERVDENRRTVFA